MFGLGKKDAPAAPASPELAAAVADIEGIAERVTDQAPPGAAPSQPAPSESLLNGAMAVSSMIVNVMVGAVEQRFPETAYTPEEKTAVAAVLAPVLLKHGITAAWMEKWREEIAAGLVTGGFAWTGYQRVRAARAVKPAPKEGEPGAAAA